VLASAPTGCRVLISEPDRDVREILREALIARECMVVTCEDGGDALRALMKEPPDVAVIDLIGRGLSGLELLARAHADQRLSAVAFVALLPRELEAEDMARLTELTAAILPASPAGARPVPMLLRAAYNAFTPGHALVGEEG
jgi:DNA-binding response OmpR family regulator